MAKRFCTDTELVPVPFEPSPKASKYKNYSYSVDDGGGDLVPMLKQHFRLFNAELTLQDWENARIDNYYDGVTDAQLQRVIPCFKKEACAIEVMGKGDENPTTILLEGYKGEKKSVNKHFLRPHNFYRPYIIVPCS